MLNIDRHVTGLSSRILLSDRHRRTIVSRRAASYLKGTQNSIQIKVGDFTKHITQRYYYNIVTKIEMKLLVHGAKS